MPGQRVQGADCFGGRVAVGLRERGVRTATPCQDRSSGHKPQFYKVSWKTCDWFKRQSPGQFLKLMFVAS